MVKVTNPAMRCAIVDEMDDRRQVTMPAAENPPINTVSMISTGENEPLKNVAMSSRYIQMSTISNAQIIKIGRAQ